MTNPFEFAIANNIFATDIIKCVNYSIWAAVIDAIYKEVMTGVLDPVIERCGTFSFEVLQKVCEDFSNAS